MSIDTSKIWPIIRLAALENAARFKGKANPKAVLGSLMKSSDEARKDSAAAQKEIDAIVAEINDMTPDEQKAALLKLKPDFFAAEQEKKEERKAARKELPEISGAKSGAFVTRMPPEPSKYNHLGHAMSFLINYLYAELYAGKCLLRFDDTNPEKEKQEFVDATHEDVIDYLGIEPDKVLFASDMMPKLYQAAADLIMQGKAYTCSCPSETMSKQRREMQPCSCRDKQPIDVEKDWMEMIEGKVDEGKLTLRMKIDMTHKNAVMRDPVIMRISKTPHYRQGEEYKVWPLYDFENALADAWNGMTHVMRSNEFDTRIELHDHIKSLFDLPLCKFIHYGRYAVEGMTTQGREIREAIESGKMIGWDDPRLLTLRALRRRGIVRESYYELAKQIGLSKTRTNLDFGVIAAINRRILDESANRYFFIEDPVKIEVVDWPLGYDKVELKLHPHKNRGGREMHLDGEFYLAKKDYDKVLNGKPFRLIDTINLVYDAEKKNFKVHSMSIEEYRKEKEKNGLIHFLAANEKLVKTRVFKPDATYVEGLCEPSVRQLKPDNVVQFERYCFARLDNIEEGKEKKYTFWYAHE